MNYQATYETVFADPRTISHVRRVAEQFNIDGRAIAGAICWEIYFNPRGSRTDNLQIPLASWNIRLGNGVGWGSMHWSTAEGLRSVYSDDPVIEQCTAGTWPIASCLRTLETATYMIAAEMGRAADAYERIAGTYIRDRPELLAALYHLGHPEEKANVLASRRLADAGAVPSVGDSAMGIFVRDQLVRFQSYQTVPTRPQRPPAELDPPFRRTLLASLK